MLLLQYISHFPPPPPPPTPSLGPLRHTHFFFRRSNAGVFFGGLFGVASASWRSNLLATAWERAFKLSGCVCSCWLRRQWPDPHWQGRGQGVAEAAAHFALLCQLPVLPTYYDCHHAPALWPLLQAVHRPFFSLLCTPVVLTCPWLPEPHSA
jgi:hypothetical protein